MRKIIVFFIVFIILIYSYSSKNIVENKNVEDSIEHTDKVLVKNVNVSYKNDNLTKELEDYVLGVVACEMPASFNEEALKAMSVAARTFALYKINTNKNYTLKSTTSDQCYISTKEMKNKWKDNYDKYYNKIKEAVEETKDEYMTYNGDVIISFYFSTSNGYTENCENVFSQKLDYLVSVPSTFESRYNYNEKTVKLSTKSFLNKLGINDDKIEKIKIDRSDTNRINSITINNKKFKGTKFRSLLSLRSTDATIKYDNDYVYIDTKGYGHGVGMSQYGANAMAKLGYKYDDILKYYYKGIEIMNK